MALKALKDDWEKSAGKSIRGWIEQNYAHTVKVMYKDQADMLTRLLKSRMMQTGASRAGATLLGDITYWDLWEATCRKGSNAENVLNGICYKAVKQKITVKDFIGLGGTTRGSHIMGQINSAGASTSAKKAASTSYINMWNQGRIKVTGQGITFEMNKGEFGRKLMKGGTNTDPKKVKDIFRSALRISLQKCLVESQTSGKDIVGQLDAKMNKALQTRGHKQSSGALYDFAQAEISLKKHKVKDTESGKAAAIVGDVPYSSAGAHHGKKTTHAMINFAKDITDLITTHLQSIDPVYWESVEEYTQEMMMDTDFSRVVNLSSVKAGIKSNMVVDIKMSTNNAIWDKSDLPGIQKAFDKWWLKQYRRVLVDYLDGKMSHNSYLEKTGSKPLSKKTVDVAARVMIKNMFPHSSKPNMRYKVNKRLAKEIIERSNESTTAKTKTTGKKKGGAFKRRGRMVAASATGRSRKAQSKRQSMEAASPVKLRNMINTLLPQEVARRMISPRLQFRTGRFASSARVQQVREGPRGGMYADYTYMTNPYATFEPGGKMGDVQRDPKRIIETSIRSIMAKQMGSKFTGMRRI